MRSSLAPSIIAIAKEQGIDVVFVGKASGILGVKVDEIFIDECSPSHADWSAFANSDDNEPLKLTEYKIKRMHKEKKPQNNDWRSGRGFNGYHREF